VTRSGLLPKLAWALLVVATVVGASRLGFLCDDAFIAFRYVSNAHDGAGLVWNKPPFLPVEGYSCFLWAMLLWGTWTVTGLEPPEVANTLSIGFGLVQLALVVAAARRFRHRDGRSAGGAVAITAVAVVVGNRTFLQWLTSGLETALFNVAFVGWVTLAFRSAAERSTRWLAAWSTFAAIAALTRPDGLLLAVATAGAAFLTMLHRERRIGAAVVGLSPLLAVLAHLAWRVWFYGEWLPNTYYAKVAAAWPAAGWRYLFCFVVEHGTWVLLPVAIAWCIAEWRAGTASLLRRLAEQAPAVVAVATTLFGVAYYVLRVGGDHFEYRVFSHVVPLSTLALAAMAIRTTNGQRLAIAALLALGIGQTFGWLQLALTSPAPPPGYSAMAPNAPALLQPLAREYDRHQAWLRLQFVCVRCRDHAASLRDIEAALPERARMATDAADLPVLDVVTAGASSWRLPDVNILDAHGLNDWVTARWPVRADQVPAVAAAARLASSTSDRDGNGLYTRGELLATLGDPAYVDPLFVLFAHEHDDALTTAEMEDFVHFAANIRVMAHERAVPLAYRDALQPNVTLEGPSGARRAVVQPRATPLSPDRVRAIETEWRAKVREVSSGR